MELPGGRHSLDSALWGIITLQEELERIRIDLEGREFEGWSGAAEVGIRMGGDLIVREVMIEPSILESGDAGLVSDLAFQAVADALSKVRRVTDSMLDNMTAGGRLNFRALP